MSPLRARPKRKLLPTWTAANRMRSARNPAKNSSPGERRQFPVERQQRASRRAPWPPGASSFWRRV